MTSANHLILLVEEPSMEAFLNALMPRLLPHGRSFEVHPFQGKADLLDKLEARLRGYSSWLPADWRLFVIVDKDDENCVQLKARMETITARAGLMSRTHARQAAWQVVNRIAVEELEAWYFGDWDAVRAEYPKAPEGTPKSRGFRDPDGIAGGTWEAFERIMQKHGYFKAGLAKIEAARTIGRHLEPTRNRSVSFATFHAAIVEALA